MRRTVRQVAKASGVSVRALHHYDALGLLKPAEVGSNGYRYYGRAELLRLQQILFYRELDVPLAQIGAILDDPGFDLRAALAAHRAALAAKVDRVARLVRTIDRTLASLEEDGTMKDHDMFEGFPAETQAEHERYLVERYGPEVQSDITASKARLAALSGDEKRDLVAELAEIEGALAQAMADGAAPDSAEARRLVERHHRWVARSWPQPPTAESYAGLADLYLDHPEFRARYERLGQGFAEWLAQAMRRFAGTLPSR
jgi:DNA-binding transcriptional MerR regulator